MLDAHSLDTELSKDVATNDGQNKWNQIYQYKQTHLLSVSFVFVCFDGKRAGDTTCIIHLLEKEIQSTLY